MNFDEWVYVYEFLDIWDVFRLQIVSQFYKRLSEFVLNNIFKITIPSKNMIKIPIYIEYLQFGIPRWTNQRTLICDTTIRICEFDKFANCILHKFVDHFHRIWKYKILNIKNLSINEIDCTKTIGDVFSSGVFKTLYISEESKTHSDNVSLDENLKFVPLGNEVFVEEFLVFHSLTFSPSD